MPPRGWKKGKPSRPKISKIPVHGEKALPGRPRRDGMPPVQKKALLTPEQASEQAVKAASAIFLAKIRHYAGRGMPATFIASLMSTDFPDQPYGPLTPDDFEPSGRYYPVVVHGKSLAAMEIADGMFSRAKDPLSKSSIEPLFWLKCNADWNETAAGREKAKKAHTDDVLTGFDFVVVKS